MSQDNSTTPRKFGAYPKSAEEYAGIFCVHPRKVKGWATVGKRHKPPELPPLDHPERMAEWWGRCMGKRERIPDNILRAAAPLDTRLPDVDPGAPIDEGSDFAAALSRRRSAERKAGLLYDALSTQAGDPKLTPSDRATVMAQMEQARRAWDGLTEILRRSELSAEKIQKATGRTLPADDVLAADRAIHGAIAEGIRGLWGNIRAKMLACTNQAEEDALWEAEVERLFAALTAREFGLAEKLDELPIESEAAR